MLAKLPRRRLHQVQGIPSTLGCNRLETIRYNCVMDTSDVPPTDNALDKRISSISTAIRVTLRHKQINKETKAECDYCHQPAEYDNHMLSFNNRALFKTRQLEACKSQEKYKFLNKAFSQWIWNWSTEQRYVMRTTISMDHGMWEIPGFNLKTN